MWHAIIELPWWGYLAAGLVLTHLTIASVTIYLHRHQAHRALALHPWVSHAFRFWLWLTTGMVTRQWVAVHRKHHAKVETPEDPHSPRQQGINRILWLGVVAYRRAAADPATIERYGFETPDDWIERNLYAAYPALGLILMLAIDCAVFGAPGVPIWVMQMLWIPFWAAGVINGIGHYWGYRNYEVRDASTNIVPWGFIIGGEELHNNHHAFGSSAKFSTKRWEFDLGWVYIRMLAVLRLATVKKTAPRLALAADKQYCDIDTVRAVITSRFHVMANFTREVIKRVYREELHKLDRATDRTHWTLMKRARRLLSREAVLLDESSRRWLNAVLDENRRLQTVYAMKEALQDIWRRSAATQETLLNALEDWCRQAETSGIRALREFSHRLPRYTLVPTA